MDDVATKIIDILKKHMKEPMDNIGLNTALTDLKIESLDLGIRAAPEGGSSINKGPDMPRLGTVGER
jgi:hypothetical protein